MDLLDELSHQLNDPGSAIMSSGDLRLDSSHTPTFALVCPPGRFMSSGVCAACKSGKYTPDGGSCRSCEDPSTAPNAANDACICPPESYAYRAHGPILCFENNYIEPAQWKQLPTYSDVKYSMSKGYACALLGDLLGHCVKRTAAGDLRILPGWGLSKSGRVAYTGLETGPGDKETVLFACPGGDANCLGEPELNGTVMDLDSGLLGGCSEGSGGALCAVCEDGWIGGTLAPCTVCGEDAEDTSQTGEKMDDGTKIVLVVAAALVALAIGLPLVRVHGRKMSPLLSKLWKYKKLVVAVKGKAAEMGIGNKGGETAESSTVDEGGGDDTDELGPRIKIFVSNFQILNMIPVTFDFKLPDLFDKAVGAFSFLNFDLVKELAVDCIGKPTYYQKFSFTMLLPLMCCGVVLLIKKLSLWRLHKRVEGEGLESASVDAEAKEIRNAALNRVFLVLFLLYPNVSVSVFNMFMCRYLDYVRS
eukprot:SAG31_NODE_6611_length_1953_cov_1.603020_1_plen_475_part_00